MIFELTVSRHVLLVRPISIGCRDECGEDNKNNDYRKNNSSYVDSSPARKEFQPMSASPSDECWQAFTLPALWSSVFLKGAVLAGANAMGALRTSGGEILLSLSRSR
jgi:hypothetical protein